MSAAWRRRRRYSTGSVYTAGHRAQIDSPSDGSSDKDTDEGECETDFAEIELRRPLSGSALFSTHSLVDLKSLPAVRLEGRNPGAEEILTEDIANTVRKVQQAFFVFILSHQNVPERLFRYQFSPFLPSAAPVRPAFATDWHIFLETMPAQLRESLPPRQRLEERWRLLYSLEQHGISLSTMYDKVAGKWALILAVKDTKENVCRVPVGRFPRKRSRPFCSSDGLKLRKLIFAANHVRVFTHCCLKQIFGAYLNEPLKAANPKHFGKYYGTGERCVCVRPVPRFLPGRLCPPSPSGRAIFPPPSSCLFAHLGLGLSSSIGQLPVEGDQREESQCSHGGARVSVDRAERFNGKFGLWLDQEFTRGHSATVPTYDNEPLAVSEVADGAPPAVCEDFECLALEVWGVPKDIAVLDE
ncbi:MAG: hypothetical protein BJ554DRAFT_8099 [Olpidium bornovanus]|uniref:Oxidation resistance protein 1 n=1 Tax=Olpidium bornovanus TaxID=278681 RepID=A0A8H8DIX4_9FUNG|nr:MAG: hypothetical protein BJ554DRAFT_8099 [Olpidium bornovanus]